MMKCTTFQALESIKPEDLTFSLGNDKFGKVSITMHLGPNASDVAFVSPACVTHWPRCTGDGNFGTMWGPTDIGKAKFNLDLTDARISDKPNTESFMIMSTLLEEIDDKLLDFVYNNQLRILGRKNLSREECKMLQIRTIRAKYDKQSGALIGHSVQLSVSKFTWDGMGGRFERKINVCDHAGAVIPNGTVAPGDVVAATMYAGQIYTGVGGDKFGIQWCFSDVSVICQRQKLEEKSVVPIFGTQKYTFASNYEVVEMPLSEAVSA